MLPLTLLPFFSLDLLEFCLICFILFLLCLWPFEAAFPVQYAGQVYKHSDNAAMMNGLWMDYYSMDNDKFDDIVDGIMHGL